MKTKKIVVEVPVIDAKANVEIVGDAMGNPDVYVDGVLLEGARLVSYNGSVPYHTGMFPDWKVTIQLHPRTLTLTEGNSPKTVKGN